MNRDNKESAEKNPDALNESADYSQSKLYLKTAMIGAMRGATSIVLEHPWDMCKTHAQVYPTLSNWQVISGIYQRGGIPGFYSGAVPNTARVIFKQAYRYPLQFGLIATYDACLPSDFNDRHPRAKKIATGLTLAGMETYLITPLEKLKVWLMTNPDRNKRLISFFQFNRERTTENYSRALIHKLYNAHHAVMYKQCVSWCTFLWFDDKFKSVARNMVGQETLSFTQLVMVGLGVGVFNTAAVMPFDTFKTRIQKKVNPEPAPRSYLEVPRRIFDIAKVEGVRVLYAGTFFRLIQYTTQAIITVQILDHLEKEFKTLKQKSAPKSKNQAEPDNTHIKLSR